MDKKNVARRSLYWDPFTLNNVFETEVTELGSILVSYEKQNQINIRLSKAYPFFLRMS